MAASDIKFKCPFCQRDVVVPNEGRSGILHEMPMCEEFMKDEDPLEFVERCRKKMAS
jgi:hypothetical protein